MIDRDKYRGLFVEEAREHLAALDHGLVALEDDAGRATVDALFRAAHSVKGAAGTLGYDDVAALAHGIEDGLGLVRDDPAVAPRLVPVLLSAADALGAAVDRIEAGGEPDDLATETDGLRRALADMTSDAHTEPGSDDRRGADGDSGSDGGGDDGGAMAATIPSAAGAPPPSDDRPGRGAVTVPAGALVATGSTVRVPVERVDRLVDLMGELRIAGTRLDEVLDEVLDAEQPYHLQETLRELHMGMRALYDDVLDIRTMPVSMLLDRIPRTVRDLAEDLGKEVDVRLEGRETTVDRSVIEALADPVLHLVRNALDHGIERPEARAADGKPPTGRLTVRVVGDTAGITVTVEDDGRGVDTETVRRRAVERGLVDPEDAAVLQPDDVLRLLTAPGFSTADEVTAVSGRGVGLDVVKHAVERFGGSLRLRARPGGGTVVTLRFPPSLAVMDALTVRVDDETWFLPVDSVVTSLVLDKEDLARGRLAPPRPVRQGEDPMEVLEGPMRLLWAQAVAEAPTDHVGGRIETPIPIVSLSDLLGVRDRPRYQGSPVARSEGLRRVERQAAQGRRLRHGRHGARTAGPAEKVTSETQGTGGQAVGVVVKRHGQRLCLVVDAIGTLREIVVKSIDSPGAPARHVSGATIDADGAVALILDVASLLEAASR